MTNWQGRNDGNDPLACRVFQRVKLDTQVQKGDFVLHGFAVDEGVRRNHGRVGAKNAPDVIRKSMANFPVIHPDFSLKDFGNITCEDADLEASQKKLSLSVAEVLAKGAKSVVVGGGHEVTFSHYQGIRMAFPDKKIGIINFDAHFDNRKPIDEKATSGTGFYQIAEVDTLYSLHIGIQRNSNTLKLFDTAHSLGMKYILAEEIFFENLSGICAKIDEFLEEIDILYITICMDVFNAAIAPGVSALAYNGIFADTSFMRIYRHALSCPKLVALDVAEVNPEYDIDNRTARLAASLLYEWCMMS